MIKTLVKEIWLITNCQVIVTLWFYYLKIIKGKLFRNLILMNFPQLSFFRFFIKRHLAFTFIHFLDFEIFVIYLLFSSFSEGCKYNAHEQTLRGWIMLSIYWKLSYTCFIYEKMTTNSKKNITRWTTHAK